MSVDRCSQKVDDQRLLRIPWTRRFKNKSSHRLSASNPTPQLCPCSDCCGFTLRGVLCAPSISVWTRRLSLHSHRCVNALDPCVDASVVGVWSSLCGRVGRPCVVGRIGRRCVVVGVWLSLCGRIERRRLDASGREKRTRSLRSTTVAMRSS